MKAREQQNEKCFTMPRVTMGPFASFAYAGDTKHLLFSMARYKFVAKMLHGKQAVLEAGCGDGFGIPIVLQEVGTVHACDWETLALDTLDLKNVSVQCVDLALHKPIGRYDAAYSLDVLEHIRPEREGAFMANIVASLNHHGLLIVGTPNLSAAAYASEQSKPGHINLKSHDTLRALMHEYFHNVLMFGMNDEVLTTGYGPMCHYLLAVGTDKKET